jgi:hypothetical protein
MRPKIVPFSAGERTSYPHLRRRCACQGMSKRPSLSERPKIILFGDSITQSSFDVGGWGSRLAHWYSRKADVVCRGLSGYNSVWANLALDKVPSNSYIIRIFRTSNFLAHAWILTKLVVGGTHIGANYKSDASNHCKNIQASSLTIQYLDRLGIHCE